jgi:hypothetical protein
VSDEEFVAIFRKAWAESQEVSSEVRSRSFDLQSRKPAPLLGTGTEQRFRKMVPRNKAYRRIHHVFQMLVSIQVMSMIYSLVDQGCPDDLVELRPIMSDSADYYETIHVEPLREKLLGLVEALPESDPIRSIVTE